MSIFSSILQKIGIGKPATDVKAVEAAAEKAKADAAVSAAMAKAAEEARARVAAAQVKPAAPAPAAPAAASASAAPASAAASMNVAPASVAAPAASPAPLRPAAIPVVDVVTRLEGLASSRPELNWKVSIVDLLKLLDIDSGFESRKELASELGCPADMMNDSARMNTWLHKTVLQKIAENGGNIPASLLD